MIAYFKQNNNNFNSNNKQNQQITNIIALDGEGWNNSEGVHNYYILSAVDLNNNKKTLYTGNRLTTDECLNFLLSLSGNKGDLFISFAFTSYDVTKILEDLTQDQLKLLRSNKEVIYKDYKIKHLKNKYFSIIDLNSKTSFIKYNGEKVEYYKNKITIYDVFSYYSCSFVKVCHQYKHLFKGKNIEIPKITDKDDIELTEVAENIDNEEELIDFITAMKATRSEFKEENLKQIIEYCELENYILATIYKHTLNMCSSIDITPSYHSGPGALAENYLETQNISKYIRLKDSKINNIAKSSYYGGRFETSIIGYAGDGYTYDINSAYPNIIINLPCLSCSSWIHTTNYLSNYIYGFYKVSVSSNLKSTWSPFPFKVTQSNRYDIHDLNLNVNQIFYPIGGTRWVTGEELRIAYKYFSNEDIKVLDGYVLDVKCDHIPFNDVITLYERRKEYKKAGNDSQIVIKLIINSLYGKLAQVVGKSKFTSWSWAAWITGHTRSMLADIALKYQNNILMLATDGIVSKCKLPELKVSDSLGDWEFDEVKDIYIFKPGLYVYRDKSGKQVAKRRGYQSSQLSAAYLLDKWSSGELIFPTENQQDKFYTYSEAVQRIDFKDKLGQWTKEYKDINLNDTRRNVANKDNNVIITIPWKINEEVGQYDDLGTKRINYDIKDKDNKLIGREVRLEYQTRDGIKKRIWQESYINNSWVNNASSLKNMLYKLPEVVKVIERQNKSNTYPIYIVEGCKNAYVLNKYLVNNKIKGIATTKLAGALNNIEAYEWLKDVKDICFILDNDEAGFKHGRLAYEYLTNLNKDINIEFKKSKTEGSGDDIVDHLEKGHKLDELSDIDINEILKIEDKKYINNDTLEENTEEITDKGILFLNGWLEVNKDVLKDVTKRSEKQYSALCPNHDDKNKSFMIGINNVCNLCVVIHCQTCGKDKFSHIVKRFTNGVSNKDCKKHNIQEVISEKLISLDNINLDNITNKNINISNKSSFPLHVFPVLLQLIIQTFSKVYLHEVDTVSSLMLSIISMVCGGKVEGKFSETWIEPISKYLLISLPPSSNKTALIKVLKKPFLDVEKRLAEELRKPINKAISLKRHYLSKAEKFSKLALKTDDPVAEEELLEKSYECVDIADSIKLIRVPKTFIDNATEESLIKTLAENGGIISLFETENAFDGFTVYSSHPKLNILTKGYSGETIRYDRVTQPSQIIDRPTINIALLTQPANIKDIINIPGFVSKGLMSRFDVVVPPNTIGERKIYTPTDKDKKLLDIYYKLIYDWYYELSKRDYITYLEYDPEAKRIFEDFYVNMQKRISPNGDLSYLAEWGGKRIGEALRYGVILHELKKRCLGILNNEGVNIMDDVVEREDKNNNIEKLNDRVNKKEATDAVKIVNWFATQIVKASGDVLQKEEDRDEDDINRDKARKLMEYLKKKEMKEFTAYQLQQKLRRKFSTVEEVQNLLDIFVSKKILKVDKKVASNNKEVHIYKFIF